MAQTIKVRDYRPKEKVTENVIEWELGSRCATLTFSEPKMIKRMKDIYNERPDEFKYYHLNPDGSLCVSVPRKWVKINPGAKSDPNKPKRQMTEEQKKAFAERMAAVRAKKKSESEE